LDLVIEFSSFDFGDFFKSVVLLQIRHKWSSGIGTEFTEFAEKFRQDDTIIGSSRGGLGQKMAG